MIRKYGKKILFCIFMILCFTYIFNTVSYAQSQISQQLINGMDPGQGSDPTSNSKIIQLLNNVFTVVQFVGTGISILMVLRLGISYMITSPDEKAELKKRAVPVVTGAALIVATVNIIKLIGKVVVKAIS